MAESFNESDILENMNTLCLEFFNHSQWTSYREFHSGSFAEIPFDREILNKFKLNIDALDSDVMKYVTSVYAFSRDKDHSQIRTYYGGKILRMFTDDVHTGYARLIYEKDNTELRTDRVYRLREGEMIHGPAVKTNNVEHLHRHRTKYLYDSSLYVDYDSKFFVHNRDTVFAIHSPYWPMEALEWVTRRRLHCCPTRSTIKKVVRYGCDFVQVSHNRRFNEGEWRFSFSKAELVLVRNFTDQQRIVYRALWLIYKIESGNRPFVGLCTYYLKTLMLWSCEEKPEEFWRGDFLVQSVYALLIEMIMWLTYKSCKNYFIPGNNMMDHLIDTDLSGDIQTLYEIARHRRVISDVVADCRARELLFRFSAYRIDLPAWLQRATIIRHYLRNKHDNFSSVFSENLTRDLQSALRAEFFDVFRGVNFHRLAGDCALNTFEHFFLFRRAIAHLTRATTMFESRDREWLADPDWVYMKILVGQFISRDSDVLKKDKNSKSPRHIERSSDNEMRSSFDSCCGEKENKYLLYSRSFKNVTDENTIISKCENKRTEQCTAVDIAMYWIFEHETITSTDVEIFKEWPGESPTVNISWFIAKAYLANLYYTTNSDVRLAIKTCDDVIDVCMMSRTNEEFAEDTFPVILRTEWSRIYDSEIQSLLGFYSLCASVLDSSVSRSVYLGVCPVQFALYVKLRTLKTRYTQVTKTMSCDEYIYAPDVGKCTQNMSAYNDHERCCRCDEYVNNGKLLLRTALGKCNNCKECVMVLGRCNCKHCRYNNQQ